jgi:hypothetical protein
MQISTFAFVAALSFGAGIPMSQPTPAVTMTEEYLLVENEDPVRLDGYFDAAGALQIRHGSDYLVNYSDSILMEHDTHTTIQVRIYDFRAGGSTYQVNAKHGGTASPINWSRGTNYAYYTFTNPIPELEIDISAQSGTSGPLHWKKVWCPAPRN